MIFKNKSINEISSFIISAKRLRTDNGLLFGTLQFLVPPSPFGAFSLSHFRVRKGSYRAEGDHWNVSKVQNDGFHAIEGNEEIFLSLAPFASLWSQTFIYLIYLNTQESIRREGREHCVEFWQEFCYRKMFRFYHFSIGRSTCLRNSPDLALCAFFLNSIIKSKNY